MAGEIESNITSHGRQIVAQCLPKVAKAENNLEKGFHPSGITDPH